MPEWHGGNAVGEGTEANKWGWASTGSGFWGIANGTVARLRDLNDIAMSDGGTFSGRELLYRWEGGFEGSVLSLGLPDNPGVSTTQNPIFLDAGTVYVFDGLYEWINNANAPTYGFSIATAPSNGEVLVSKTYSVASREIFHPFNLAVQPSVSGGYYLQVKQIGGLRASAGGLIGLARLHLDIAPQVDSDGDGVLDAIDIPKAFEILVLGVRQFLFLARRYSQGCEVLGQCRSNCRDNAE